MLVAGRLTALQGFLEKHARLKGLYPNPWERDGLRQFHRTTGYTGRLMRGDETGQGLTQSQLFSGVQWAYKGSEKVKQEILLPSFTREGVLPWRHWVLPPLNLLLCQLLSSPLPSSTSTLIHTYIHMYITTEREERKKENILRHKGESLGVL